MGYKMENLTGKCYVDVRITYNNMYLYLLYIVKCVVCEYVYQSYCAACDILHYKLKSRHIILYCYEWVDDLYNVSFRRWKI